MMNPQDRNTEIPFHCTDTAGRPFLSVETWAAALGWPESQIEAFRQMIETAAAEDSSWTATHNGMSVYRWPAVAVALLTPLSGGTLARASFAAVRKNYEALCDLGSTLQEQAIYEAGQDAPDMTLGECLTVAMEAPVFTVDAAVN